MRILAVVETREVLEVDRALEFPAHLETSVKRMIAYGQCCCETAEVISGVLLSATLTKALREKLSRLRDGQKVIGREMLSAVTAATEEGKRQEAAMLELPLGDGEMSETPQAFR
jgi:hypothetical protein